MRFLVYTYAVSSKTSRDVPLPDEHLLYARDISRIMVHVCFRTLTLFLVLRQTVDLRQVESEVLGVDTRSDAC